MHTHRFVFKLLAMVAVTLSTAAVAQSADAPQKPQIVELEVFPPFISINFFNSSLE